MKLWWQTIFTTHSTSGYNCIFTFFYKLVWEIKTETEHAMCTIIKNVWKSYLLNALKVKDDACTRT